MIAAHAELGTVEDGVPRVEGAWAGELPFDGKNKATYFTFD